MGFNITKHLIEHAILGLTGSGGNVVPINYWGYQDFNTITSTNITITRNENADAPVYDVSNIISNSAVITTVDGKAVYTGTIKLLSNLVSVQTHLGTNVTLSAIPSPSYAPYRIWFLLRGSKPQGATDAPKFVTRQRIEMVEAAYVNQYGDTLYGNIDFNSNKALNLPQPTSNGEPLIYGNDGEVYFYDTSRNKRLSISYITTMAAINSSSVSNRYLRQINGMYMNINGFLLPFNATLIGIIATNQIGRSQSWTAEVRKNGSSAVIDSITINNTDRAYDMNKNTDFNAGDIVQIYANGSNIRYPKVILYFRRRG